MGSVSDKRRARERARRPSKARLKSIRTPKKSSSSSSKSSSSSGGGGSKSVTLSQAEATQLRGVAAREGAEAAAKAAEKLKAEKAKSTVSLPATAKGRTVQVAFSSEDYKRMTPEERRLAVERTVKELEADKSFKSQTQVTREARVAAAVKTREMNKQLEYDIEYVVTKPGDATARDIDVIRKEYNLSDKQTKDLINYVKYEKDTRGGMSFEPIKGFAGDVSDTVRVSVARKIKGFSQSPFIQKLKPAAQKVSQTIISKTQPLVTKFEKSVVAPIGKFTLAKAQPLVTTVGKYQVAAKQDIGKPLSEVSAEDIYESFPPLKVAKKYVEKETGMSLTPRGAKKSIYKEALVKPLSTAPQVGSQAGAGIGSISIKGTFENILGPTITRVEAATGTRLRPSKSQEPAIYSMTVEQGIAKGFAGVATGLEFAYSERENIKAGFRGVSKFMLGVPVATTAFKTAAKVKQYGLATGLRSVKAEQESLAMGSLSRGLQTSEDIFVRQRNKFRDIEARSRRFPMKFGTVIGESISTPGRLAATAATAVVGGAVIRTAGAYLGAGLLKTGSFAGSKAFATTKGLIGGRKAATLARGVVSASRIAQRGGLLATYGTFSYARIRTADDIALEAAKVGKEAALFYLGSRTGIAGLTRKPVRASI
jgi:hypothetical protein